MKYNKDILELFQQDREPFAVYSAPISQVHRVTIDDDFREVSQFAELVDVLDSAQEGDVVQIRLSTIGGALHSIIPLINALKNTDAFVHTHVESDTASCGTMIMSLSDNIYINEYATIMYHNVTFGAYGHGGNVEAQVNHTIKSSKKLIRDIYHNLLTDEEIKRLEDGLELYMTAEECMERFALRKELDNLDAELAEAEKLDKLKEVQAAQEVVEEPVRKPRKKPVAEQPQEA